MRLCATRQRIMREIVPGLTSPRAHRIWTAALRRICRNRSVILGYHGVAECPRKEDLFLLQVPAARFRGQLEMMREAGFRFATVVELARMCAGGPPPPGIAAVSFDDAM